MANFLDKAIAAISPEKGYRRAVARTALSIINNGTGYGNYGASHTSRSMRSWHVGGGSAKEDIEDNLETLRKRSRDAYMGIPLAAGAIKTLRTNVVGSGLVPTPQVDAATQLLRLAGDTGRPLLATANRAQRLADLQAIREPMYREVAHHIFDTSALAPDAAVAALAAWLATDETTNA